MRAALACLLMLAACSTEPEATSDPAPPAKPSRSTLPLPKPPLQQPPGSPAPAQMVASLAGEWRVAGIDGKDFDEPYGLELSGNSKEIWWAPRCAGLIRSYAIDGTAIRIGPAIGYTSPSPGQPTPTVCAIGLPPRIDEVTRALDAATTVRRTPANGIELSGGGRSLLLLTQ